MVSSGYVKNEMDQLRKFDPVAFHHYRNLMKDAQEHIDSGSLHPENAFTREDPSELGKLFWEEMDRGRYLAATQLSQNVLYLYYGEQIFLLGPRLQQMMRAVDCNIPFSELRLPYPSVFISMAHGDWSNWGDYQPYGGYLYTSDSANKPLSFMTARIILEKPHNPEPDSFCHPRS